MNIHVNVVAGWLLLATATKILGQPAITLQPTDQSVSIGANVTYQVRASGAAPLDYRWHFNDMHIAGATDSTLVLTNVQPPFAGTYTVVVGDSFGSVTSRLAKLVIDGTFTKIAAGPVVNDRGSSAQGIWADYDGDGYLDLFVSNGTVGGGLEKNSLYHNNGNETFTKVTADIITTEDGDSHGGAWGDYDNDGFPDLFVPSNGPSNDLLYKNSGVGSFTKITNRFPVVGGQYASGGASWADFDNDGYLDLYVPTFNGSVNRLFRNNGDGTFSRVTDSPLVRESGNWAVSDWGDFDNDGRIDLFVSRYDGQNNALYRNLGSGAFARISTGHIVNDGGFSIGSAWADFDNDGFLDLFVVNGGPNVADSTFNFLYHNSGDGTFTKRSSDFTTRDRGSWATCAWGDYDNDGFLDLFVANQVGKNALYHNNGDGTFTKITVGSPANEGNSFGCSWADYNNDGFLDLFVANGSGSSPQNNFLYRNNGNSNGWLKVKPVGTQSNRAGIGAKVRIAAEIRGTLIRQLRQISGGTGGQSALMAHFGLGDATSIDTLRIEWPSGAVQEYRNLPVNRLMNLTEPAGLQIGRPLADGSFRLQLTGGVGFQYDIETSSDLRTWTPWITLTCTNRTMTILDSVMIDSPERFYRVRMP